MSSTEFEPRALHLHTLETLLADLVSGRAVIVDGNSEYSLSSPAARSALEWYRQYGASNWPSRGSRDIAESLVDAIQKEPPSTEPLTATQTGSTRPRIRLNKLEAHRFGGIHKYGTPDSAPDNFVHDFSPPLTLLEGSNGSGKTSIVNAIIWALTGEILRAQRGPEPADVEFECSITESSDDSEGQPPSTHLLTPITPVPDPDVYKPTQEKVPVDTWVELTFEDETGALLPPIRRTQTRTARGKLEDVPPNLSGLGIDPISFRIGTVMPGLLAHIHVGSESELGRAVAQLTGLSALVDLADHIRRTKGTIGELAKNKAKDLDQADARYKEAKADLEGKLQERPAIAPQVGVPDPSDDKSIEEQLEKISNHFGALKTEAFNSAKEILGDEFDPSDQGNLTDLEQNIGLALSDISKIGSLRPLARLKGLAEISIDELDKASQKIESLQSDALKLVELARDPSTAARARLYAHIAQWGIEHPDIDQSGERCAVCSGPLAEATDPITGKPVIVHLDEAEADAALLSQTLERWAKAALNELTASLPQPLQLELNSELPDHPCDVMRAGIIDFLFDEAPFKGVLKGLKAQSAQSFDAVASDRVDLPSAATIQMPESCGELASALEHLEKAIRFAHWRKNNGDLAKEISEKVLGRVPAEGEANDTSTLRGKLLDLEKIVKGAKPLNDALEYCKRLKQHIATRRAAEKRTREYEVSTSALAEVQELGDLADRQVAELRSKLSGEAATWRDKIYVGAFPSTAQKLVDTKTGRKGELEIIVEAESRVAAPAQHVSNASAVRANLVGFFFAFWEHVLKDRGGLRTIILDDPQEMFDHENRERIAHAMGHLVDVGGQVIVTSYDKKFAERVGRLTGIGTIAHYEVRPATKLTPCAELNLPRTDVLAKKALFDKDPDNAHKARDFADASRVFLEGKLSELFDDYAFATWVKENPHPALASFVDRLRQHLKDVRGDTQSMFASPIFKRFVDHPAMTPASPVLVLMNKAHHGQRQEITAGDVAACANDLSALLELAEAMFEECCRWRRRDQNPKPKFAPPQALSPMSPPSLEVAVCPDLAAFTQDASPGGSQDNAEALDTALFENKAVYFLRRDNFGFAAPGNGLALVEADPLPVNDRRLVIARYGESVFARRLVRSPTSDVIGLTAEIPDPRQRSPKTLIVPAEEVALHQVVGIIFDHDLVVGHGPDEAVLVDAEQVFSRIEIAFRVVDESAVPLALNGQVVLGGAQIPLTDLGSYEGRLVALSLDDGSSVFKRVGAALPGELSHLRKFESIGGLGSSQVLSLGKPQPGIQTVERARLIFGVLYHA